MMSMSNDLTQHKYRPPNKTLFFSCVFILEKSEKTRFKMLEKFRGTLYGVLVGDCFGALFQEQSILSKGSRLVLKNFLDNLEKTTASAGIKIK